MEYYIKRLILSGIICLGTAALLVTVIVYLALGIICWIPAVISGLFIVLLIFLVMAGIWGGYKCEAEDNKNPADIEHGESPGSPEPPESTGKPVPDVCKDTHPAALENESQVLPDSPSSEKSEQAHSSKTKILPEKFADESDENYDLKTELLNTYRLNQRFNKKPETGVIFTEEVTQRLQDFKPTGAILKSTRSSSYLFRLYEDLLIPKEFLCGKEYRNLEKIIGNKRYNFAFRLEPEYVTADMILQEVVPARVIVSRSKDNDVTYYEVAEEGRFIFRKKADK